MSGFTNLVTQNLVLLGLIAIVGVIVGWSFGSLRASKTTAERYDQQLRATLRRMSNAEADVVTLRANIDEYQGTISSQSRENEAREHLLAALEARLAEAEGAAEEARRAGSSAAAEPAHVAQANGALPQATSIEEVVIRTSGGQDMPVDDLTRIKGIGKVIQGTLNGLGITSYAQIARLTEHDVALVEDAMASFRGRIQRDDWMASASALHQESYGTEA